MNAQTLIKNLHQAVDVELDGPNLPVRVYGSGGTILGLDVNRDDYGVAYEIVIYTEGD